MAQARLRLASGSGSARAIYRELFATGRYTPEGHGLSPRNAAAWRDAFVPGFLELVQEEREGQGSFAARKLVYRLSDGECVETVYVPMPGRGRGSLCISSQVGCRMGCAFCQTAVLGLRRNLSAAEMVAQVMGARFGLGLDFSNIVFMGMGEPLDNAQEVFRALGILRQQEGLRFDAERITICTSAPPGGIEALAALGIKRLNLSISLNAANDEKRQALMPVTLLNPLEKIAASIQAYPRRKNFIIVLNYCLMPGINDGPTDAIALAQYGSRLGRSLVNLIPYNPGVKPLCPAPSEAQIEAFLGLLKDAGQACRRRALKGGNIMAACGQLGLAAAKAAAADPTGR